MMTEKEHTIRMGIYIFLMAIVLGVLKEFWLDEMVPLLSVGMVGIILILQGVIFNK